MKSRGNGSYSYHIYISSRTHTTNAHTYMYVIDIVFLSWPERCEAVFQPGRNPSSTMFSGKIKIYSRDRFEWDHLMNTKQCRRSRKKVIHYLLWYNPSPTELQSSVCFHRESIRMKTAILAYILLRTGEWISLLNSTPLKRDLSLLFNFKYFLPTISTAHAKLQESNSLGLLCLTFTTGMNLNNYLESFA